MIRAFIVALLLATLVDGYRRCPTADHSDYRSAKHREVKVIVTNNVGVAIYGFKILKAGDSLEAQVPDVLIPAGRGPFEVRVIQNQVYRFRTKTGTLIETSRATGPDQTLELLPCNEFDPTFVDRSAEFEALILGKPNDPPCEPAGKSGSWRCQRTLSRAETDARNKDEFGFHSEEAAILSNRRTHDVIDPYYGSHVPQIPSLTQHGTLRMRQTQKMQDILNKWYAEEHNRPTREPGIGGGYSNGKHIELGMINLDRYPHIRKEIVKEVQDVLEWWTGTKLIHTMTFGARIYKRDSMLINHVDRMDTHLASVVIQVAQHTDEDGGWPLEVVPGGMDGETTHEVYLHPGDMVLYEGARLHHGRPMRFKGENFTNIFGHYVPVGWNGVSTSDKDRFDYRTRHQFDHQLEYFESEGHDEL